uniref:Uncharacterized protein n=1 Tax=viral metagenome TaxID=1070528 RepID=A0A6M3M1Y8_9ZZZZ
MISSCGKEMADALRRAREARVKKVLFMVRRQYYDDIVSGEKREEIRNPDKWQWLMGSDPPKVAVFMCGKNRIHRRQITRIYLEDPAKVLGREPSYQGKLDLCYDIGGYPKRDCIVVELGDVYSVEGIERYMNEKIKNALEVE